MSRHSFILDHAVICGLRSVSNCLLWLCHCLSSDVPPLYLSMSFQSCHSVHLSVYKIVSEDQYFQPTLIANLLVWKFSVLFNV